MHGDILHALPRDNQFAAGAGIYDSDKSFSSTSASGSIDLTWRNHFDPRDLVQLFNHQGSRLGQGSVLSSTRFRHNDVSLAHTIDFIPQFGMFMQFQPLLYQSRPI